MPRFLRSLTLVLLLTAGPLAAGGEPLHGVHTTTADIDRLKAWQEWTGKPTPIAAENLWATSWQGLTGNNPHTGVGMTLKAWREAFEDPDSGIDRDTLKLSLSVPMFPDSAIEGGTDYWKIPERWQQGADGKFNQYFRQLAETLVREQLGRSYLRLAWEFNVPGHWNRYAIRDEPEWWPLFVKYWRQIHRSMMSVDGAEFRWVWCVSVGEDTEALVPTRDAWPGDDVVDVVGVDFYDGADDYYSNNYQHPDPPFEMATISQWLWDHLAHGIQRDATTGKILRRDVPCLDSYYAFAKEHGKGFGVDEWGVAQSDRFPTSWGSGGNDNPGFIENVHRWMAGRDVEYTLYFEYFIASEDYGFVDHSILPGYWNRPETEDKFIHPFPEAHPRSSARYLELFHGKKPAPAPVPVKAAPLIDDSFTGNIPAAWKTEGPWTWRRGALSIEDAPADSRAWRDTPDLKNRAVEFRIALPTSFEGVESRIGPYAIEFTRNRHGNLDRVRLRRCSGKADVLADVRPEFQHVVGRMYLPIRVELRRLDDGMETVSLFAGQEKIFHYLDLERPADSENQVVFSAGEGTTLFLDDFIVRPLAD